MSRTPGRPWSGLDRHRLALACLLAVFTAISLFHLEDRRLQGDEAVTISHAQTVARTGTLGSDLWRGIPGADRHVFFQQPLYALLIAPLLSLDPVGLRSGRALSLLFGTLLLLGAFSLGRQLAGPTGAWIAVFWLLFVRSCLVHQGTGIPLWDQATVVRSDIAVATCAVWSGSLLVRASRTGSRCAAWAAGLIAALGFYAHHFGLLLPAALLAGLAAARPGEKRGGVPFLCCAIHFGLAWLVGLAPYALDVISEWDVFRAQMELHAGRVPAVSPAALLDSIRREPLRFATVTSFIPLQRPALGAAVFLAALPLAVVTSLLLPPRLAGIARRAADTRFAGATAATLALLLLFLDPAKGSIYWITLLPFAAVALAGATILLLGTRLRALVVVLGVLLAAESLLAVARHGRRLATERAGAHAERLELRRSLQRAIPRGEVAVGAFRHALALSDEQYRAFLVVWFPSRHRPAPASQRLRGGLQRARAGYLVVDADLYTEAAQLGPDWVTALHDLLDRSARRVGRFRTRDEPSVEVWQILPQTLDKPRTNRIRSAGLLTDAGEKDREKLPQRY